MELDHVVVAALVGSYLDGGSSQRSQKHNSSVLSAGGLITLQPNGAKSSLPAGKYALFQMRQRKSGRAQILYEMRDAPPRRLPQMWRSHRAGRKLLWRMRHPP